jgi:hypothetical protein
MRDLITSRVQLLSFGRQKIGGLVTILHGGEEDAQGKLLPGRRISKTVIGFMINLAPAGSLLAHINDESLLEHFQ